MTARAFRIRLVLGVHPTPFGGCGTCRFVAANSAIGHRWWIWTTREPLRMPQTQCGLNKCVVFSPKSAEFSESVETSVLVATSSSSACPFQLTTTRMAHVARQSKLKPLHYKIIKNWTHRTAEQTNKRLANDTCHGVEWNAMRYGGKRHFTLGKMKWTNH